MKANRLLLGLMASGLAMAGLTQSCISDMPFADGEGEGTLRMQLVVNSDITRASLDSDEELMSKCKVYLSGTEGLLYKYDNWADVPTSINLKSGNYYAEAWTGDSVPASFEKRFYRGYEPFTIAANDNKAVLITCKIANVVVSVDPSTITDNMMRDDWKLTVYNSTGELEFNAGNMNDAKGYYMMSSKDIAKGDDGKPRKAPDGWNFYTNLNYKLEGTRIDGTPFSKEGPIGSPKYEGNLVEHAHEYVLKFKYDPTYEETGGSFVTIEVDDTEILVEQEIGLYSRPSIKGVGYDISKQVIGGEGGFEEKIVRIGGFKGIRSIMLSSNDYATLGFPAQSFDLQNLADGVDDLVHEAGINWTYTVKDDDKASLAYVYFTEEFLNRLEERSTEYDINILVEDGNGRTNEANLRIAVGAGAVVVEDPVVMDPVSDNDLLAVRSTYAVLTGEITSDDALNPELVYRVAGESDWKAVAINLTRGTGKFRATLGNLQPDVEYEYAGRANGIVSTIHKFRTEKRFDIPNGNMESWSTYGSGVVFPGAGSAATFWDTGNQGAKMGNATLTDKSTTMFNSASYSAKLETKKVLNLVIAAGNMFSGTFGKTSGTSGAELTFGRPFDGSHPDAMRVWANYRPATVNSSQSHTNLKKGELDHGQVYVAFVTEPITFNTANKEYFEADNPSWKHYGKVVGYGEITWEGQSFGPDGALGELIIPITWRENARTMRPTHIVIVCSASKYGDYFVGGQGSVMYLDDFELLYDSQYAR